MKKEEFKELTELIEQAHQIKATCYKVLENAPQAMSNVYPITDILTAVNNLFKYYEREE
jgi:hypothetical protein